MRFDFVFVNLRSLQVGRREKNDIGFFNGVSHVECLESVFFRYRDRLAAFVETHDYIDPTILEVKGMGMTLRTEPDDRTGFPLQVTQVGILISIHFCWHKTWREKELIRLWPWRHGLSESDR